MGVCVCLCVKVTAVTGATLHTAELSRLPLCSIWTGSFILNVLLALTSAVINLSNYLSKTGFVCVCVPVQNHSGYAYKLV